ncbi:MAG: 6-bladed beta-propeller [Rhodothermales bacterium]
MKATQLRSLYLLPLFAIMLIGCAQQPGTPSPIAVQDSSGVTIIDNLSPAWDADTGWQVDATPAFSIGELEGDPAYLFAAITGVRQLSDGRIVVAEGRASELRFYDHTGSYLSSVGRKGQGPGEFEYISFLGVSEGDTLVAGDAAYRISVYDAEGRYVRTSQIAPTADEHNPIATALLGRDHLITLSGTLGFGWNDTGRVLSDTMRYYIHTTQGAYRTRLRLLPARQRWGLKAEGIVSFPYLPLTTGPSVATSSEHVYLGTGRRAEIEEYDQEGQLVRILRWNVADKAVDGPMRDQYGQDLLADYPPGHERRARWEAFLSEAPFPERLPVYQSLLVDAEEHLWVEAYRPAWDHDPRWYVFNREGQWMGVVETPASFQPFEIGTDYLLGIHRDEHGIQRVHHYALRRDARTPRS